MEKTALFFTWKLDRYAVRGWKLDVYCCCATFIF